MDPFIRRYNYNPINVTFPNMSLLHFLRIFDDLHSFGINIRAVLKDLPRDYRDSPLIVAISLSPLFPGPFQVILIKVNFNGIIRGHTPEGC